MSWRYRPGGHWAVVGARSSALILGPSALGLAERVWGVVSGNADIDVLVEALAREGLAHLPAFALVEYGDDTVRVLVRGDAEVCLRTAGSPAEQIVHARGVRSWREEVVLSVTGILLRGPAEPGEEDPAPHLPVLGGIVRAFDLSLAEEAGPASILLAETTSEQAGDRRPESPPAPELTPVPSAGPPDAVAGEARDAEPEADLSVDAGLTLDEAVFDLDVHDSPSSQGPPGASRDEPSTGQADREGDEVFADDEYLEWVSGATRLGSVEDAAVREGTDHVGEPVAPPPTPSTPPRALPPFPPVMAETSVVSGPPHQEPDLPSRSAPDAPRTVISSIPFATARKSASPNGPGALPPQVIDEDAGLTVARAPAGGAGQGVSVEPRVGWLPSVVCDGGHANPPESERCRVCGADLAAAEHRWVERPAIGQLRFAGPPDVVPLTGRTVVIGRAPRVDGVSGDAVPDLVVIPNAGVDISRSHVRIDVEGWHVMVVDLHARNGTIVVDPRGESRRLHPGEEKMIVPGTRVVLSDDVQFVFEVQS